MAKRIKMKTHSGAAKRFKVTGKGKIVHRGQGMRHIQTSMRRKRQQDLKKNLVFAPANNGNLAKLLPYK